MWDPFQHFLTFLYSHNATVAFYILHSFLLHQYHYQQMQIFKICIQNLLVCTKQLLQPSSAIMTFPATATSSKKSKHPIAWSGGPDYYEGPCSMLIVCKMLFNLFPLYTSWNIMRRRPSCQEMELLPNPSLAMTLCKVR